MKKQYKTVYGHWSGKRKRIPVTMMDTWNLKSTAIVLAVMAVSIYLIWSAFPNHKL